MIIALAQAALGAAKRSGQSFRTLIGSFSGGAGSIERLFDAERARRQEPRIVPNGSPSACRGCGAIIGGGSMNVYQIDGQRFLFGLLSPPKGHGPRFDPVLIDAGA